jgi:hypothetical protein
MGGNVNSTQVDLCGLNQRFLQSSGGNVDTSLIATFNGVPMVDATQMYISSVFLSGAVELGMLGLYGGHSCAYYSIMTELLPPGSNCSTSVYGGCRGRSSSTTTSG